MIGWTLAGIGVFLIGVAALIFAVMIAADVVRGWR